MTINREQIGAESDRVVMVEIGSRLARRRIAMNLTQAQLANQSGVAKRTVERLESGASVQTGSLLRVLRELGLQDQILAAIPREDLRPIDLLRLKGKERKRARTRKSELNEEGVKWKWGAGT